MSQKRAKVEMMLTFEAGELDKVVFERLVKESINRGMKMVTNPTRVHEGIRTYRITSLYVED